MAHVYGPAAAASGGLMACAAGFDSVPADMGTAFTADALQVSRQPGGGGGSSSGSDTRTPAGRQQVLCALAGRNALPCRAAKRSKPAQCLRAWRRSSRWRRRSARPSTTRPGEARAASQRACMFCELVPACWAAAPAAGRSAHALPDACRPPCREAAVQGMASVGSLRALRREAAASGRQPPPPALLGRRPAAAEGPSWDARLGRYTLPFPGERVRARGLG